MSAALATGSLSVLMSPSSFEATTPTEIATLPAAVLKSSPLASISATTAVDWKSTTPGASFGARSTSGEATGFEEGMEGSSSVASVPISATMPAPVPASVKPPCLSDRVVGSLASQRPLALMSRQTLALTK